MQFGSGVAVAVVEDWKMIAASLILPLAWELPYATGMALKKQKKKKKKKFFCVFNPGSQNQIKSWQTQ